MYYYKLKPHITTIDDFTIPAAPAMSFMLHPNFYIARAEQLDLSVGGNFKYLGWTIRKSDIHEILPGERPEPAKYMHPTVRDVEINFSQLHYFSGTNTQATYRDLFLKDFQILHEDPVEEIPEERYGPEVTTLVTLESHLKKQIRTRYAIMASNGHSAEVIDSFYPHSVYCNHFTVLAPHNAVALSESVSVHTGIPQMDFGDMLNYVGYDRESLFALLDAVKRRGMYVIFAGVGGTGMNTLYWLTKAVAYTGFYGNLFERLELHDADSIEFSNLLRFPMYFSVNCDRRKAVAAVPYARKLARNTDYQMTFITPNAFRSSLVKSASKPLSSGYIIPERTVVYGAPTLESRQFLSEMGNFIAATHADNSCSLWLNPSQDLDIQMETYGLIQLNSFFMNQLRMAIGFLEILADNSIDLKAKDQHLLEYSFTPPEDAAHIFTIVDNPTPLEEDD